MPSNVRENLLKYIVYHMKEKESARYEKENYNLYMRFYIECFNDNSNKGRK